MKQNIALCVVLATVAALAGELTADVDSAASKATLPSPERARVAFERYKSLAGDWSGASSEGWKDQVRYETIARQSVVMQTSLFEAHPGETMVTMIHLHEGQLMLTHYCVAGNQPRLVASAINADASEITFTYKDGTGLATRDEGHMDKAVIRFSADDVITSRWTWYQDGQESWMEEIRLERED